LNIRTVLICHEDDLLNREGFARWLASFTQVVGIVVLRETKKRKFRRIVREVQRVGLFRFIDVISMRIYYKLRLAAQDKHWENNKLNELRGLYPNLSESIPILIISNPNLTEAQEFIRSVAPEMIFARCKQLLHERIFSLAPYGTWVIHPGICPEYRNAHGCFWALAQRDLANVGLTLLRVDKGVDTGPVYAYYSYPFDERNETYMMIMHRCLFDNLEQIKAKIIEIYQGTARAIDTQGRRSKEWGQPWLSKYLQWRLSTRG
jgi:hypothetical protein